MTLMVDKYHLEVTYLHPYAESLTWRAQMSQTGYIPDSPAPDSPPQAAARIPTLAPGAGGDRFQGGLG